MEITEALLERIRAIMLDGNERRAIEVATLAGCNRYLMRAALSHMADRGLLHVARIERRGGARMYRLGPGPVSTDPQSCADPVVSTAFNAMVRTARPDD